MKEIQDKDVPEPTKPKNYKGIWVFVIVVILILIIWALKIAFAN